MRAVFYKTHGDAQALQVAELDKPAFGPVSSLNIFSTPFLSCPGSIFLDALPGSALQ